jgi:hypothetical protein
MTICTGSLEGEVVVLTVLPAFTVESIAVLVEVSISGMRGSFTLSTSPNSIPLNLITEALLVSFSQLIFWSKFLFCIKVITFSSRVGIMIVGVIRFISCDIIEISIGFLRFLNISASWDGSDGTGSGTLAGEDS